MYLLLGLFLLLTATALAQQAPSINATLVSQDPDPVEPGDTVDVRFRLENFGSATPSSVEVELLTKYPFSLEEPAVKPVGSLDANQRGNDALVVRYTVIVDNNVPEGEYELFLRYRVGNGEWTRAGPFLIDVQSAEKILTITGVSTEEPLRAGSVTNLNVEVTNYGGSTLQDIRVNLNLEGIPFAPVEGSNEQVISRLGAGEVAVAPFKIIADPTADAAYYKTGVTIDFLDDSGNKYTSNSTIGLLVYNPPQFNVALESSAITTPSSNGEIVLSISNIGVGEIKFLTVSLKDSEEYRVISTPNVYVGNLEADDFETAQFTIKAKADDAGEIPVTAVLTYKDVLNNEFTEERTVKLPTYSSGEARELGLTVAGGNFFMAYLTIGFVMLAVAFIVFMLVDALKNKMPGYKKALWIILILTGPGAVVYYFIARRR